MNLLDEALEKANEERRKSGIPEIQWVTENDGKLTLLGVLAKYYDEVTRTWRSDSGTKKPYFLNLCRFVFPYLNDKPLEDCEKEDFDELFAALPERKKAFGHKFNDRVEQNFWNMLNRILTVASDNGICPNVLYGSEEILSGNEPEKENEREFVRLKKSLDIGEENRVAEMLLFNPEQTGQRMGLALMFCLGLRNSEACGADFSDVHPMEEYPETNYLLVYKTTEYGRNSLKMGGKTKNMYRMVPIPSKLKTLLEQRMEWLSEKAAKGEIPGYGEGRKRIDSLPIACDGTNFGKRCSARHLTKEGKAVLEQVKMDGDILSFIEREMKQDKEGVYEKDPTSYLFRRNLGTHLSILGLTETEIQYIMGHEITGDGEWRSIFRNEEKLYPIAQKMAQRPIVNDEWDKTSATEITGKSFCEENIINNELRVAVTEPIHIRVQVRQQEPRSKMRIELIPKDVLIQGTHTQRKNGDGYCPMLVVMGQYRKRYREWLDREKKRISEGVSKMNCAETVTHSDFDTES